MRITNTVITSLNSLRRNPTRTVLTTLGIVIGIAAVITMMEIGNGSKNSIKSSIEKMGANIIMIRPGSEHPPGGPRKESGTAVSLVPSDAEAIAANCPNVASLSPVVRSNGIQIIFGNTNWSPGSMYGVAPTYFEIRNWTIEEGRFFTNEEVSSNACVCVVGATIVKEVFNNQSPLACELRIGDVAFQVIGVLKKKGANMMGMDEDDVVIAPWSTLRMRITGLRMSGPTNTTSTISSSPGERFAVSGIELYPEQSSAIQENYLFYSRFTQLDQIVLSVPSPEQSTAAIAEVTALLRQRHRLADEDENDFIIRNSADFMAMLNSTSGLMTNLLLGVALISLVVGGVGIMNIMLVSVTERTREIGLRMAVGARSRDILKQFLIESVVLCISGGILGIILGHGSALLIEKYAKWPIEASPEAIVAAVAVSATVGIIFGFYPAWKASKLDPIDALHYE